MLWLQWIVPICNQGHSTLLLGVLTRDCNPAGASTCLRCGSENYGSQEGPGAICFEWQYISCSGASDAVCKNCSQCPLGKYLRGCTSKTDSVCSPCTNKYEVLQCNGQNNSVSVYTGPGLIQSNCPWKCIDSYYADNGQCFSCSTSSCNPGQFRAS